MSKPTKDHGSKLVVASRGAGTLWLIGWLFTIGFAHLSGWSVVWGLFAWPYFLGTATR